MLILEFGQIISTIEQKPVDVLVELNAAIIPGVTVGNNRPWYWLDFQAAGRHRAGKRRAARRAGTNREPALDLRNNSDLKGLRAKVRTRHGRRIAAIGQQLDKYSA